MSFTPGSGAVISLGVDGATASKREIESVADSLRRLNDSNFKKLSDQVGDMQGKFGNLKSSIGDILQFAVAGFGIGAFAGLVKGSIDALDNLNDLSKTTGITVANLSGLKLAANQSGGDLEGIAASISKLSVSMGKDAERFKLLGVTAKDPLEAFKQLSDVFSAIDDPQTRAALGAEALGRGWASAAPLLSEGGKKIGEMVDKGKALSTATQEMADRADEFNDNMATLGTAVEGATNKIVGDMLPGLASATTAIADAYEESGKLHAAWVALGALGMFVFTDEFASTTTKLKHLQGELDVIKEYQLNAKESIPILGYLLWGSEGAWDAEIAAKKKDIADVMKSASDAAAARAAKSKTDEAAEAEKKKQAAEAARKTAEFIRQNEDAKREAAAAAKKSAAEYAASVKGANDYADALRIETSQIGATADQVKLMNAARAAGKAPTAELRLMIMQEALALHVASKAWAEKGAAEKAAAELQKKFDDSAEGIWDQVRALEEQISTYGLIGSAVIELQKTKVLAKLSSLELSAAETAALESELAGLTKLATARRQLEGMDSAKKSLADLGEETRRFSESVESSLTDALMRGFESGKGFGENLVDTIENMFGTMVLRPTVQAVGQLGGSMVTQGFSALSPDQTGGSMMSTLLGGGSTAGALYNAYTSSTLGQFMSGASGSAAAASQALGAPMTAAAQAGSYAAQAAPYLGAAAGGYAAYSMGERIGGAGGAVAGLAAGAGTVAVGGMVSGALAGTGMMAGATQALAALGPWGWAAIAGLAIIGSMQDGPEEKTRIGFNSNNAPGATSNNERGNEGRTTDQYIAGASSTGAFGSFGVTSTFWATLGPTVDRFVDTVTQTDDALAQFMTSTEKAATVAALTGKQMTSNGGPEGSDANSLGGLDAVFRQRISTILDTVDPALAKLLDGFTGTSQALASEATALLDYRKNLPAVSAALFGVVVTVQDLAALRTPVETVGAALIRVTNAFQGTNAMLDLMGVKSEQAFGAVGLSSLEARQRVVDLAGGMDALSGGASYFSQNFVGEADRLAPVFDAVTRRMSDLGYAGVTTADGYRDAVLDLVKSGKLAGEAGASTYVELLKLGPGFKLIGDAAAAAAKTAAEAVADAAQIQADAARTTADAARAAADAAQAAAEAAAAAVQSAAAAVKTMGQTLLGGVDDAFSALQRVTQASADVLTKRIEKERALSTAIRSTLDSMDKTASDAASRQQAQGQIRAALAIARAGGPLPDAAALSKSLSAVSRDASDMFSTYADYQRDFYSTQNDIAALGSLADSALSVDEQSLNALNEMLASAQMQIDLLKGIDISGLTVAGAMAGLQTAIAGAKSNPYSGSASVINRAYLTALGRAPDAAGMEYWQTAAANGNSMADIIASITNSEEAKSRKVPGFAAGGDHAGGWRIVGENGPELEATGAARLFNAQQTSTMLGRGSDAVLLAEVKRLREAVERLEQPTKNTQASTAATADLLNNISGGGGPLLVKVLNG